VLTIQCVEPILIANMVTSCVLGIVLESLVKSSHDANVKTPHLDLEGVHGSKS